MRITTAQKKWLIRYTDESKEARKSDGQEILDCDAILGLTVLVFYDHKRFSSSGNLLTSGMNTNKWKY